jgi:hypothetical protein
MYICIYTYVSVHDYIDSARMESITPEGVFMYIHISTYI